MSQKTLIEEEEDRVRFYENVIKMLKQKLFKVGADSKPEFTGNPSELKELLDMEVKLMTFKRKRLGWPI